MTSRRAAGWLALIASTLAVAFVVGNFIGSRLISARSGGVAAASPGTTFLPPATDVASPPDATGASPSAPPTAPATENPEPTPVAVNPPPSATPPGTEPSPAPTDPPMPTSPEPEDLHMEWPVHGARVTTWFAPTARGFVVIDGQRVHNGLDLASFCGDWVRAAMDGTVVYAGRKFDPHIGYSEYPSAFYRRIGNNFSTLPVVIVLDHGNGYRTLYAHVREKVLVEEGDTVKAGEIIGRESDTGRASGCHLHFELIRMDGDWMPVAQDLVDRLSYPPFMRPRIDPMRVLRFWQPGAGIRVRHYPPPKISPGYGPLPVFMKPVPPLTEPANV